jgi:hypothetical protein
MDHFIDQIEIHNFKSIRELQVSGFKRINLFIGRPNVGKSNILEALSLFSLPYLWEGSKKLTDLVRLTNLFELFYDGDYKQACKISIGLSNNSDEDLIYEITLGSTENALQFDTYTIHYEDVLNGNDVRHKVATFELDTELKITNPIASKWYEDVEHIMRYTFKSSIGTQQGIIRPWITSLRPPFGDNLLHVLERSPSLAEYFGQWFKQYGLRLVIDRASQSLKVMKDKGDTVFILPYSSIADTLQRIIFYKTAVASNKNSVLLFEEPEAHAYPPYISEFTHEVVKSMTNQFFIVTHSPLIVEQFLTDAIDDLGIFMVDFKDGQTIVKGLTTDEIREVYRYGMDLFFNGDSYLT